MTDTSRTTGAKKEKGAGSLFSLNERAAQAFLEIAEYLELSGENKFKIKAYSNAASLLRQLDGDLEELAERGQLTSLPGVGKAIAEKLAHFLNHGTIPLLEELRAQIPPGLLAISSLPGLGPKKTAQLNKELGVGDLRDLQQALLEGRVVALKGFTARSVARLSEDVERALSRIPTYIKSRLESWSEQTQERLRGLPGLIEIHEAGLLRRRSPEPTGLDLLLVSHNPEQTRSALHARLREENIPFSEDEQITAGQRPLPLLTLAHPSGAPVRLALTGLQHAAWNLLLLTGPQEFVDHVAARLGGGEETPWEGASEHELLEHVRLSFMVPEIRHRRELWEDPPGPLLSMVQMQGNLHAHSTDSDGTADLEEMAQEARHRGHSFYGVTDHSRSLVIAGGLSVERLLAQNQRIRALNQGSGDFTLFSSTECDILEDGQLDYPAEVLDQLDYVVVAVHSFFQMDSPSMTERMLRGLAGHPRVKILAHPTGRMLTRRDGYAADWARVFEACARLGVAVEINANPWRLDISEELLDLAVAHGCLIAINTDAHSLAEFDNARHGVDMARRGAVAPDQVVNTWSAERLREWFNSEP
jgi:DNA polymerase (family 10)